ncbi:ATP-binding protein [Streptacidiphilus fuscans]|uniref:ATP-binding protein n=1 Tax=Streptacidiphilus fuscans TaxID=2789292 RepID=A0A931BBS7_9ACTN|nr:ATP-binding protein [Streptacidiphilus fuscans]MBF9073676.1 ATP-binding protein [Streptacidiphilus fuscans]
MGPRRSHWLELPAERSSVAVARHRIAEQLDAWSVPRSTRNDAILLLSELATNAVVHTASTRMLCGAALLPDGRIRVEVHDDTPARCTLPSVPDAADACGDEESGRGLFIVQQLADAWGIARSTCTSGTFVWATLAPEVPHAA